jgi:hypothetical protein
MGSGGLSLFLFFVETDSRDCREIREIVVQNCKVGGKWHREMPGKAGKWDGKYPTSTPRLARHAGKEPSVPDPNSNLGAIFLPSPHPTYVMDNIEPVLAHLLRNRRRYRRD